MRQTIIVFLLGVALAATGAQAKSVNLTGTRAATAKVTEIALDYKVFMGGIQIAKMSVEISLSGKQYWVKSTGRTVNFLDKISRTRFSGSTHGIVDKGIVRPKIHKSSLTQRGRTQTVKIVYDEDGVPKIKSDPPFGKSSKRAALLAKTLPHTIDPASLFIAPLIKGKSSLSPDQCNGRAMVLDGRRRFDIFYKHKASYGAYRLRKPDYVGPALLCTARIVPVGGFRRKGLWPQLARQKPTDILLVPVAGGKYLVPIKIVTDSPLGKIVVWASGFLAKTANRKISFRDQ